MEKIKKKIQKKQKKIERNIEDAYQKLYELKRQIAEIGPIKKGTLSTRKMKCGKKSCRCYNDPQYRHGPYHWWTTKVKGRSKAIMVHEEMFELYQSFTNNNKELQRIIKEMEKISDIILEEKTKLFKIKKSEE